MNETHSIYLNASVDNPDSHKAIHEKFTQVASEIADKAVYWSVGSSLISDDPEESPANTMLRVAEIMQRHTALTQTKCWDLIGKIQNAGIHFEYRKD